MPPRASEDHRIHALVENHRTFLRFLERRVGSREKAEDILQDAFGRALARVDTVRDDETVVAWFYRLLRNAVVDHHRRARVRSGALERFARELGQPSAPELQGELCGCVLDAASGLKPEYARVLQRVDVEDAPVKVFAEEAGITPANASVRLFRAREALRRRVKTACGVCAEHGCVDCSCRAGHG